VNIRRKRFVPSSAANQSIAQQKVLTIAQPTHVTLLDGGNGDPAIRSLQVIEVSRRLKGVGLVILASKEQWVPGIGQQL
jgi:hypothetical protein